jgi:hypothetical protein
MVHVFCFVVSLSEIRNCTAHTKTQWMIFFLDVRDIFFISKGVLFQEHLHGALQHPVNLFDLLTEQKSRRSRRYSRAVLLLLKKIGMPQLSHKTEK